MPIYALVLTSPPTQPSLSDFAVGRAFQAIPEAQRRSQRWLSPREAWEAEFATNEVGGATGVREEVMAQLHGLTLDVNIVVADPATRRNKLLVADMESTVIVQECLDELADRVGKRAEVAEITDRAMRGELDFEAAITHRVGLLAGLPAEVLDEVAAGITLMPGAEVLLATMKRNGAYTALVSGGFTVFAEPVARRLGFDEHHANRLEIAAGKLTGRVVAPILGREAKLATLERLKQERGVSRAMTMAVGDGANDLDMVRAAGLGVAFRAKPLVAAAADASIAHGDLTALLYMQGYASDELVSG